jgi:hypothetical protein
VTGAAEITPFAGLTDEVLAEGAQRLKDLGVDPTLPSWLRRLGRGLDGQWFATVREVRPGHRPEYREKIWAWGGPTIVEKLLPLSEAVAYILRPDSGDQAAEHLLKLQAEEFERRKQRDSDEIAKNRREYEERQRQEAEAKTAYERFEGSAWSLLTETGQMLFSLALIEDERDPNAAQRLRSLGECCRGFGTPGRLPFPGRLWRQADPATRRPSAVWKDRPPVATDLRTVAGGK